MSVLYPWQKGYWDKFKPGKAGGASSPSMTPTVGGTTPTTDVSYGANSGSGSSGNGTVTPPSTDVSYGANAGTGSTPSTVPSTSPTAPEVPPTTDVSYGGNTGTGSAPVSLPNDMAPYDKDGDGVLSDGEYELYKKGIATQYWDDYLTTGKKRLETQKNNTYAAAAEAKKRAEEAAERAHERAVVDAQVAGEQNKASYGAQAERLASMGMSGGGYSDYLNAQAYAQSRGEIQAAGAEKTTAFRMAAENESDKRLAADLSYGENMGILENTAAKGKLDADLTYAGNMQTHNETQRKEQEAAAVTTILSGISAGNYATKEDAVQAARDKGITDENVLLQIGDEWTAWNQSQSQTYNQSYATVEEMAKSGNYTAEEIRSWCEKLGIADETDINTLVGFVQKNTTANYAAHIESGGQLTTDDITEIEKGVASGDISAEDAAEWRAQWVADYMETEDPFLDETGARLSKKDATEEMSEIINSPWCTTELKAKLQKAFDGIYKTTSIAITSSGNLPDDKGSNFTLSYGAEEYLVQNGGKVEGNVVYAAEDIADGKFFIYGEDVYFKQGGTVYIVADRPWARGYSVLKKVLKEGGLLSGNVITAPNVSRPTGGGVPVVTPPTKTFPDEDDMISALTRPTVR